jgi:NAD(P)-dependent dehydrogenase (short-subunit alcohol dehydrogenase family)
MKQLGNVLVTGGSRGLGAAVVEAVVKAGGRPMILDRRADPTTSDIPQQTVDLSRPRHAESAVRILAEQHGGIDAVVTAAGIDLPGRLSDVPGEQWDQVIAVDLLGTVAVIRAALPYLVRSRGHVVTIASTLGLRALSDATAYCAAKFGVVGFTRALAAEMNGEVGVTLVVPGGMRTNFFDGRDPQYKPGADAQLNDPADVASTIIFAMSQPSGCSVRELVVCPSVEPSYP